MKKTIALTLVAVGIASLGFFLYKDKTKGPLVVEKEPMTFFITSSNPGRGGDLGGLEGADTYCSTLAERAGVTGKTWRAYLSTTGSTGVDARDRIGNGPWHNAKGELVASSLSELHGENFLTKSTALDENGKLVQGRGDTPNMHDILTGSLDDGTASTSVSSDTTCSNWTSSSTGSALVGHHDRVGRDESAPMKSWNSAHGTRGCDIASFNQTGGGGLYYCFAR